MVTNIGQVIMHLLENSNGDKEFKEPTRLRLDEDDYKKLRKYLPIINNI